MLRQIVLCKLYVPITYATTDSNACTSISLGRGDGGTIGTNNPKCRTGIGTRLSRIIIRIQTDIHPQFLRISSKSLQDPCEGTIIYVCAQTG